MKQYICSVCGFVYDEAKGMPEAGIAPGTKWGDLPEDWVCPLCGASKSEFREAGDVAAKKATPAPVIPADMAELTALEMSALCSNLARGCEKQYKAEEAGLFTELADRFSEGAQKAESPSLDKLLSLIDKDLAEGLPAASAAAHDSGDRGALRALVWDEKVTRILRSLLERYAGEAITDNTGVYVCTICGFIYVGDTPPALCPVCKVPSWKFDRIEGRQ